MALSLIFMYFFRLQELSSCSDESPDLSDIELIQYINVDILRLVKIFQGLGFDFFLLLLLFTYYKLCCTNKLLKYSYLI